VWKKFGDVQKENIESRVELGTEINAAIDGRHRRLPVLRGEAVILQTDETGSKAKVKEKHKINTEFNVLLTVHHSISVQ
jgi:hypothetical protein